MTLDDLMVVWQSQDAAPRHDVNKTLLHLALRQDEAKLQKKWRIERWIIYVASAGVASMMTFFLAMMTYARDRNVLIGWDFAIPIVGAIAALLAGIAMYVNRKGLVRREQSFGESLRDQLNRRIAQLDDRATSGRLTSELVLVVMGGICPMAIFLLGLRINQQSFRENGPLVVGTIVTCVGSVAAGIWTLRRQVRKDILPRKHRLEALLKDIDAP